jgi:hypothetical protein
VNEKKKNKQKRRWLKHRKNTKADAQGSQRRSSEHHKRKKEKKKAEKRESIEKEIAKEKRKTRKTLEAQRTQNGAGTEINEKRGGKKKEEINAKKHEIS